MRISLIKARFAEQGNAWEGLFSWHFYTVTVDIAVSFGGDHEVVFHVDIHQVIFRAGLHRLVILPNDIRQLRAGDHLGAVWGEGERIACVEHVRIFVNNVGGFCAVRCLYVMR